MCGICGIYSSRTDLRGAGARLKSMSDAIVHRGPDGEGHFLEQKIALGHRRLSIIDLEGGDQPIYNEDHSICVVFNGEIYNFTELREELIGKGHEFRTHSDTEVIVHAYEQYGTDCVKHFNGMFCFALWDKNTERLFIARDRMGEKPLYYRERNGEISFASELKSLLVDEPDIELDTDALEQYLTYGYVPKPFCIVKGIKKLPEAHTLTVEKGQLTVKPYWEIPFPASSDNHYKDEHAVTEAFESLLSNAIDIRLRSDVPVGAFLSGGTDSNLIVAMASELSSETLSTYTVGFSEASHDEMAYARMTAERYGTNHHEIVIDELDADLFPKIVKQFDEPFADSSAIPTYYVNREAARDLKVCLSGDAGDELFCGYDRYNFEAGEGIISKVPAGIRKATLGSIAALMPDTFRGKGWMRRHSASNEQKWQRMMGPFDYFERKALYNDKHRSLAHDRAEYFSAGYTRDDLDEISKRMLVDQSSYLPDDILVKVDRTSMWHSLEVRVPFLDHRLVEFANSLPLDMKKRDGVQKLPIRHLLQSRVAPELLNKPKTGFGLPIKHWMSGSLNEFTRDMLDSPDTKIRTWMDKKAIKALIDGHGQGRRDLSKRIWTLLWLEQWCREFNPQ